MTTRERCLNILHYKDADRMPAVHFGYWAELLDEWAEQGHISADLAMGARSDGSKAQRELDKIKNGTMFQSNDETTKWICLNCGHVMQGKTPPQICPVCSHAQGYFSQLQQGN